VAKHVHYLHEIAGGEDPLVSQETSGAALVAWVLLRRDAPRLPVPAAGVGEDGEILYTWNQGEHHLELEISSDGSAHFYYLNRKTDLEVYSQYVVGGPMPRWVVRKLGLFER
jgi:hypothetical protein